MIFCFSWLSLKGFKEMCIISVNYTDNAYIIYVIDTGEACITGKAGIFVGLVLVSINNTGNAWIASVVDASEIRSDNKLIWCWYKTYLIPNLLT